MYCGYVVFGNVVQGLEDVVDIIASKPTGTFKDFANVPLDDIQIIEVSQIDFKKRD